MVATPPFPLRILHLGVGAFHRAHQAVYLQRLLDAGDRRWSLVGGNIRADESASMQTLVAQGGAYTLETVAPDGTREWERINALSGIVPWEPSLCALIDAGASEATRIVSFTVTEAGYALDAEGRLDLGAAEVAADLAACARDGRDASSAAHSPAPPRGPKTLYGTLAAILRQRMRREHGGVTLLNCDNLRHNGERARSGLRQFLQVAGEADLLRWTNAHTRWPNAMVDRITPRPTADAMARAAAATGREDPAALMAERYLQWVIEDDFIAGRPAWETVGAQMVASVAPYEEAKIRLLNATHSAVAWAGALAGMGFIHEAARDPGIAAFARAYALDDAIPALLPSPIDLRAYFTSVLERFGNAAIRDTIARVASNGYTKLAGFVAPTLRERLAKGEAIDGVALLPALFLAHLARWRRDALPYPYDDEALPIASADALCNAPDPVAALAADRFLWGDAASSPLFVESLRRAAARVDAFASARGPQIFMTEP